MGSGRRLFGVQIAPPVRISHAGSAAGHRETASPAEWDPRQVSIRTLSLSGPFLLCLMDFFFVSFPIFSNILCLLALYYGLHELTYFKATLSNTHIICILPSITIHLSHLSCKLLHHHLAFRLLIKFSSDISITIDNKNIQQNLHF